MSSKRPRRGRRSKSEKKSYWFIPILVICIGVFSFAAYQLFSIWQEYEKGDATYEDIHSIAIEEKERSIEEYETYSYDFDKLKEINSDVVGWIRFDQPEIIDYPIVAGVDNNKYLKTDFNGGTSDHGTIFLDMRNAPTFTDKHAIVYGHNMKNDSMFGALNKYSEEAFYEENPYFYIYTPDGKVKKYHISSARVVKEDAVCYNLQFADDAQFIEHLQEMESGSLYDTGVDYDENSQLVTLSTCTAADDDRFIVQGILIEEREVVRN